MEADTHKVDPPKRNRRWYQFSLRTLLIFTAVVAAACGWLGNKIEQKRQERAAVQALRALGAKIWYDYQPVNTHEPPREPDGPRWLKALLGDDFFAHVEIVALPQQRAETGAVHLKVLTRLRVLSVGGDVITDDSLAVLSELNELEELELRGSSNVSDRGIANLRGLHRLRTLDVAGTQLTDAGLETIAGLTQLKQLDIGFTRITDDGLTYLKGLTLLEDLELSHTSVTGASLEQLKHLARLESLKLHATNLTDVGLKNLSQLTQLKYLNIDDTRITDSGVANLKSLTRLQILWLPGSVSDAAARELQQHLPEWNGH